MSSVVVCKGDDGKLQGLGEKGGRAWRKFMAHIKAMAAGETLEFAWQKPRSLRHHKLFFAKLHALADRQEQFEDADRLRMWLTVGAGYCDLVPGPKGRMVALPQSIAFHKLDEIEFGELHAAVDKFLWTEQARRFLWPHISDELSYATVEQLQMEFS